MNDNSKKILVATADIDSYEIKTACVSVKEISTVEDLYAHILKDEISPALVELLMQDRNFKQMSLDWHIKDTAKQAETLAELPRYYVSKNIPYSLIREVDLNTTAFEYDLYDPAAMLLKEVSFKSLGKLNPGAYRRINAARKKAADEKEKREQRKAERKQAQKLARQILRRQCL